MALTKRSLGYLLFFALMVTSLSCDQGTKVWARKTLAGGKDISVIKGFFDLRLAQNPGGAFSLFGTVPYGRYLLTAIGLALLVMLFIWVRRIAGERRISAVALGLIAGGAIGNLYDRITLGSVTDFIYWHWHAHSWPIFNIADALLLIGVGLLFLFGSPKPAAKAA